MGCLHSFKVTPYNLCMNCKERLEKIAKKKLGKKMFTVEKSSTHHRHQQLNQVMKMTVISKRPVEIVYHLIGCNND